MKKIIAGVFLFFVYALMFWGIPFGLALAFPPEKGWVEVALIVTALAHGVVVVAVGLSFLTERAISFLKEG